MQPVRDIAAGRRRGVGRVAVAAFGAATLCMIPILGALVSPTHNTVYHLVGPASALFVPALFNLFLLTFLLWSLLVAARPSHRFGVLVWAACLFFIPWIVAKGVATLYQLNMPHRISLALFLVCGVCVLLATALWKPSRARLYDRGLRFGCAALGLAAIFGVILTLQTCWFGWQARHLNDPETHAASAFGAVVDKQAPAGHGTHPRVLWIIFDELAHDQVFQSRFPGLKLPHLDAFAAQSVVFDHVKPAYTYTEIAIPALMSDVHGNAIRASADGSHVEFRTSAPSARAASWQAFDERHTVFADAQALGYQSAVVGWFNPYCRLLPSVLTSCFWTNQSPLSAMFPARTIGGNLFHPAARLLADIPRFFFPHQFKNTDPAEDAHLHIDDYAAICAAADKTLLDPDLDFVLLHLPIPHPNGIYDRHRRALTTGASSYVDNLALVDEYLGHVRRLLEQQQQWDDTTVVIMGDHSWRTRLLWIPDSRWSTEDQLASHGGQYDDRPFYAVKLPHQQSPERLESAFSAVHTQDLLDALLRRDISSPAQLAQWAQATK